MTPPARLLHAFVCLCLALSACSKKPSETSDTPTTDAAVSPVEGTLVYQETVRVVMGPMQMELPLAKDDVLKGSVTMMREFIADVKQLSPKQKTMLIRRYVGQKIGDIYDRDIPRSTTTNDSSLTGRSVHANLGTDQWDFTLTDGEENKREEHRASLEELDLTSKGDLQFYQNHSMTPGETWSVPIEALSRWMGRDAKPLSGDINMIVDRLETVDDIPCAILTMSLDIQGKLRDEDDQTLEMKTTAKGEITRSLQHQMDLKVQIDGTMDLFADVDMEGTPSRLTLNGPVSISEKREIRK